MNRRGAGNKGSIKWKMDSGTDRAWAGDVACCGVNNRGVALWKDKIISMPAVVPTTTTTAGGFVEHGNSIHTNRYLN